MSNIKKYAALFLLALAPLLTGCVKMTMDLKINTDATISGNAIFAVSDALAALSDTTSQSLSPDSFINVKSKGVRVEKYEDGKYTGERVIFDHAPTTIFAGGKSDQSNQSFSVKRVGSQYQVAGELDLSSGDLAPLNDPNNPLGDAFTQTLLATADLRITVAFPGKVISANGTINHSDNSICLLYTSPSPRDYAASRMPSSA